jgi:hypothetical protein
LVFKGLSFPNLEKPLTELQGFFPGIPKPDPYASKAWCLGAGSRASGVLVKECLMETNGLLDGTGEDVPGHGLLNGTDLEIAYNLQGQDLVLRVNKSGVLVFRVMLRDAAKQMPGQRLVHFNSFAPDFMFTIGDSEEGLNRMLAAIGMAEPPEAPRGGFIRRLLGRS